ncbi:DUF6515 family protein [Mariniflexile ostreae]|uniref:DUF6515 family protein n=1 Tax=Mariniflexile ostreae TaxID=1520892 RepID=A0ABV5FEJ4_9FLAO
MKTRIKTYVLSSFVMMVFMAEATGQTRRSTTTVTTTVSKNTVNRRIPSTKVTYKTPKRKVVSVRTLPNRTVVKQNGQNYYYANNKYYTQSRGRYIVIAPKVGFRVAVLPTHYRRIIHHTNTYYNAQGIFYIQVNNGYEVVDPEVGTIVYELPADYEKVVIDGQSYYEYANILYEKIQVDGTRAYEVVGIIDME